MKALFKVFTAVGLTIFFNSCQQNNAGAEDQIDAGREVIEEPAHDGHGQENHEEGLQLNHGEPWQANIETTEGVMAITALLNQFEDSGNAEDYQELAKDLRVEFNQIFKLCTMKGEAHNQLHNFLLPLKEGIDGLESDNLEEARSSLASLKEQAAIYPKYFVSN